MDKICSACACGWSIQLEKALRSPKPGYAVESIRHIGQRLSQWNREPQLTMSMCNIFGLIPGEDRLFADAILFRIADAFVSGDKDIRSSIVKVFLLTLRDCKPKGHTPGIFSNMSKVNRLELLRRVKAVLHVECVKSRASTLIMFGCWAEFAKDVAEIRDVVFSSLASRHVLEVRASLFAAGCFSELSEDFGTVLLGKLLTLIASQMTFPALRIAGARSFAKIGCSLLLAVRSYKAGSALVKKIVEEDVLATMLMALTKISLKTAILIHEHVILLCSFLSQTTSSDMQTRILRCLRHIAEKSACFVPTGSFPFQCLFRMLDEPSTSSALRCEILHLLLKLIAHGLPDMLFKDTDEFIKLLGYVENATRSPFLSERLLAFESLMCISTKLKRTETMSEADLAKFSSGVATTVLDQISVLANRLSGGESCSEVGKELRRMLHFLLALIGDDSKLGYFVLGRLHLIIKTLVDLNHSRAIEAQKSEVHRVVDAKMNGNILPLRVLMLHIHKFLVAFTGTLNESGGSTEQVVCELKSLICFVCGSSAFDCSIHTFYALIWHSHQSRLSSEISGNLLEHETATDICAKNMLAGGDNWCAYKAGRYAACEGVWDVANYMFEYLVKKVQSDVFTQWLQLLIWFTESKKDVKVLLFVLKPCALDNSHWKTISSGYIEKLSDACAAISSSKKLLEAISLQTQALYFQSWFMALRLRVLLGTVDIVKLLNNFLLCKNGVEGTRKDMISSLVGVSSRLASLAEEFDLVTSSFIDMDSGSLKMLSDLALSCSMLAFFTKVTTLIAVQNSTETSGDCLNVIAKDLVGRLWHVDSETCMNLLSLLKDNGVHESCWHFLPEPRLSKFGGLLDDFLKDSRYEVKRMIELQHESLSVGTHDVESKLFKDGMESLLRVIKSWMQKTWKIPKYFFRVRRTMGALLFCSSTHVRKQREIILSPGSHLELNLCIQLKDVPTEKTSGFSKLYCILHCRKSFSMARPHEEPSTQPHLTYQASEIDTMVHLNKKLQSCVLKQTRESMKCRNLRNDAEVVEACLCFETNGRTQGFSTCLLDVSSFPVGSYRIYWHSGGIDNQGTYRSILPLCPGPQFNVR